MTGSARLRPVVVVGLIFALLATSLQYVQGEEEQLDQVPSEVQCRPYIEKALKDREAGTVEEEEAETGQEDAEDTTGEAVSQEGSDQDETPKEDGEDSQEKSGENAEQAQDSTEGETEKIEAEQSVEDAGSQRDAESTENVESLENIESAEDQTVEAAETDAEETIDADKDEKSPEAKSDETLEVQVDDEAKSIETEEKAEGSEEGQEKDEGTGEQQEEVKSGEETASIEDVTEKEDATKEDTQSVEETVDTQSVEETTEAQSVEGTVDAQSVEETTEAQSVEETAEAQSVEETVEAKSVEETAEAQSVEETAEAKSVEETAEAKSVEETTEAQSVEETAEAQSVEEPTAAQSVEEAPEAQSVEETTEAQSVEAQSAEDKTTEATEEQEAGSNQASEEAEQPDSTPQDDATAEEVETGSLEAAEDSKADEKSAEEAAASVEAQGSAAAESSEDKPGSTEAEEAESKEQAAGASTEEGASEEEKKASREKREAGDEPDAGSKEEASAQEKSVEEQAQDASEEGEKSGETESAEPTPEEDLIQEIEIPENLRPRDHINQILKLDEDNAKKEAAITKVADVILKELKRLYDTAIQPLETLYKYRDLSNRHFGDPEIFSKPLVLFMGPWSGGKSSIINYLLENEYEPTALRTGAEPSPAYFNILMHGEDVEVLDGTQLAADWTFSGLQKFGQGLLDRLRGLKLNNKLLEKVNIVEIPGILEIRKQVQRLFPFNDACQWFIDRADIIFLVYDPSKLDVGPETEAILDQLKGREYQTRIILNKADQVKPEELMRVQGALIWNISPLMSSAEPPVMYSTSLWSMPYEAGAPTRLLYAQERAFLRDLRSAIDKRVEHKIASARRFAVRVRNHAKMVDCYLTTYYNHKTFFGSKKEISDKIIENPQEYHIYEGLSTLTNISRYDLPDPDVYRDFFRLNGLYDFPLLSSTCTYFRGCPINRLDVAIAYDLPELVGKYKKSVEALLHEESQSAS